MSTTRVIQRATGPVGSCPRDLRSVPLAGVAIQCVLNAFLGMVSGRSTELSSPGSAATT